MWRLLVFIKRSFAISPHVFARAIHLFHALSNQRAQGKPDARCTRGLVCKNCAKNTHTSIQVQRRQSDFPCAVVLTLIFVLSPAIRPWVVTVACASSRKLD